jgi:hypothetical protein
VLQDYENTSDLYGAILSKECVRRFQVSVANPFLMEISQSLQTLHQVSPYNCLFYVLPSAFVSINLLRKISASTVFHDDAQFSLICLQKRFQKSYDVLVSDGCEESNFV